MSEGGEKRFDPTPARRERAKRDGNAARSSELAGVAAFGGGLAGFALLLPVLGTAAANAVRASSAALPAPALGPALTLIAAAFVPAACAAALATLVSLAQTGGLHVAALKFSPSRLAPLPALRRMFGGEAAVGGGRAALAFAVVGAAVAPICAGVLGAANAAGSPLAAARLAGDAMLHACFAAAATGTLFAGADYALVRRRWLRSLKMTFDEFKRDLREHDGDPQAKSRRKQMHRALARGGVARTTEASFVVVNPAHVAIGIRYRPPAVPVPEIVVRALDDVALAVRALARRANIPLIEDVGLARLLYRLGEAGRPIPAETFVPVAIVIAALIRSGALEE